MSGNVVAIPIAGDHESRTKVTGCVYVNTDHITSITVDGAVGIIFIHTVGEKDPITIERNWLPIGWDFDHILCVLEWDAKPLHPPAYNRALKARKRIKPA